MMFGWMTLLLLCLSGSSLADAPPAAETTAALSPVEPPPHQLALTISGGATLGIHEAGYLYVLTEALARMPDGPELVLATGASAGSSNTLLALMGACGERRAVPSADLGYQTWVNNGLDDILEPRPDSRVALFSQQAMFDQLEALQAAWARGLSADCSVTIAIPVTRLQAVSVPVGDGLSLPRQTVRFIVQVDGQGEGVAPRLSNVADGTSHLLPLTGDPDTDLGALWRVIVASAAFPGAFAPVSLGACPPSARSCETATETAHYIDGGVFDNVPLRTAHRLTPEDVRHIYLDPAIRTYPETDRESEGMAALDLGFYIQSFADGFVSQARAQEVYALAENNPEVFERVFVSTARLPQAGAHLENFFGLFERSFREFDYALGMVDAWAELPTTLGSSAAHRALEPLLDAPEWDGFHCIRGWLDLDPTLQQRCDATPDANFRALVAVAVGRAWTACRALPPGHPATRSHALCREAAAGGAVPTVVAGLEAPADLLVRPDETDLEHAFRILSAAGFTYHDLDLASAEADRAAGAMSDRLAVAVDGLAQAQDSFIQGRLVAVAGRQALASVLAAPLDPRRFYVMSGTVGELGGSVQVVRSVEWMRLHAALQGDGLVSIATRDGEEFSVSPALGVELDPTPRSAGQVAPVLGFRVSRQLALPDRFGAESCSPAIDPRLCSQTVLQTYGALTAARLIRTQVGVDLHPWLPAEGAFYDLQLTLGIEL